MFQVHPYIYKNLFLINLWIDLKHFFFFFCIFCIFITFFAFFAFLSHFFAFSTFLSHSPHFYRIFCIFIAFFEFFAINLRFFTPFFCNAPKFTPFFVPHCGKFTPGQSIFYDGKFTAVNSKKRSKSVNWSKSLMLTVYTQIIISSLF